MWDVRRVHGCTPLRFGAPAQMFISVRNTSYNIFLQYHKSRNTRYPLRFEQTKNGPAAVITLDSVPLSVTEFQPVELVNKEVLQLKNDQIQYGEKERSTGDTKPKMKKKMEWKKDGLIYSTLGYCSFKTIQMTNKNEQHADAEKET